MKRSEIATIILVAGISAVAMFALAQSLLADKVKRSATTEQTIKVSDDIEQPSKRIFNSDAINPTIEVCVETAYGDGQVDAADCTRSAPAPQESASQSVEGQPNNSSGN